MNIQRSVIDVDDDDGNAVGVAAAAAAVFTCASSNLISHTRANFYNECSLASQPNMPKTFSQSIRFERNAHGTGLLSSQFYT